MPPPPPPSTFHDRLCATLYVCNSTTECRRTVDDATLLAAIDRICDRITTEWHDGEYGYGASTYVSSRELDGGASLTRHLSVLMSHDRAPAHSAARKELVQRLRTLLGPTTPVADLMCSTTVTERLLQRMVRVTLDQTPLWLPSSPDTVLLTQSHTHAAATTGRHETTPPPRPKWHMPTYIDTQVMNHRNGMLPITDAENDDERLHPSWWPSTRTENKMLQAYVHTAAAGYDDSAVTHLLSALGRCDAANIVLHAQALLRQQNISDDMRAVLNDIVDPRQKLHTIIDKYVPRRRASDDGVCRSLPVDDVATVLLAYPHWLSNRLSHVPLHVQCAVVAAFPFYRRQTLSVDSGGEHTMSPAMSDVEVDTDDTDVVRDLLMSGLCVFNGDYDHFMAVLSESYVDDHVSIWTHVYDIQDLRLTCIATALQCILGGGGSRTRSRNQYRWLCRLSMSDQVSHVNRALNPTRTVVSSSGATQQQLILPGGGGGGDVGVSHKRVADFIRVGQMRGYTRLAQILEYCEGQRRFSEEAVRMYALRHPADIATRDDVYLYVMCLLWNAHDTSRSMRAWVYRMIGSPRLKRMCEYNADAADSARLCTLLSATLAKGDPLRVVADLLERRRVDMCHSIPAIQAYSRTVSASSSSSYTGDMLIDRIKQTCRVAKPRVKTDQVLY